VCLTLWFAWPRVCLCVCVYCGRLGAPLCDAVGGSRRVALRQQKTSQLCKPPSSPPATTHAHNTPTHTHTRTHAHTHTRTHAHIHHQVRWRRIVLDEAHCIKDRSCNTAKAVFALASKYKWALSGTPLQVRCVRLAGASCCWPASLVAAAALLAWHTHEQCLSHICHTSHTCHTHVTHMSHTCHTQNRVAELYSLIRFLRIHPYSHYFCSKCDCSSIDFPFTKVRRCGCRGAHV
jgi:DNA repair protein RAD16